MKSKKVEKKKKACKHAWDNKTWACFFCGKTLDSVVKEKK